MSGRIYSSIFDGVAVTALQDLFEIVSAASACVEILSVHLSQETEVADAAEEMLTIAIQGHTGAATSGSGGSTPAVVPTHLGDAAAVAVVEANNTTEISGGTSVTHSIHNWNIRVPLDIIWIPETRIWVAPTDWMTVTLLSVPADSITMGGSIYFREVGGA